MIPSLARLVRARRDISVKVREVLKILKNDGWYHTRTRGSHRQFRHPSKRGLVTIAGKVSDDLATGTLMSIFKQAGIQR